MITWLLWSLIVSLQPSHALTVTVLDAEGRPVEDAVIARADRFVFARSGPDGTAELFLPASAPILFEVDATGYQRATRTLEPPLPTRVSVRLSDAARLVGSLVDEHFEALPGTVQLDFGTSKRIAKVDEEGIFDLEIEPDEAGELLLASPEALPSRFPVEPLGRGEIRDLGEIVLEPGLVVTGGVVSPDGTPAEGAEAWVLRRGGDGPILAWLRDDRARAITDESGRFRLSGIAAEPARVVIEAANAARHEVMIRPEPEEESLDLGWIQLEIGVEVRVEVSPEEEGMVRLDLGGQARPSDVLDAPPEDGVATFHNVPTGQVVVSVIHVSTSHGPQLDCRRRVTIPAEVEIFETECRSERVLVAGRARLGDRPAEGWLFWRPLDEPDPEGGDVILGRHSSTGTLSQELVSQRTPHPTVRLDAEGRFATELRAGDWEVSRQAEFGSASASERVRIPENGLTDLDLRFPALFLEGRVVDIDRRPVEGARVLVVESSAHAVSGADGTFALAVEAPGRFTLFARDRERTSEAVALALGLDSEQKPDQIELVLDSPAAEIPIRVTDRRGQPASGALVFVETAQGTRLLTADSRGEVSWKPRPPEPARWRAAVHAGGRWAFSAWRDFDRRDVLDLAATGSGRLRIEAELGRMITIEGPDGWDLSFLSTRLGLPARIADGGILELHGLPPGSYRVASEGRSRSAWLGEDDETEIDLRE